MAEKKSVQTIVRQALQNPSPVMERFLNALYDANDYLTYAEIERVTELNGRQVASVKSMLTKRLQEFSDTDLRGEDLFDRHGHKDYRIRPDLRAVVGEVLGKEEEGLREPTTPVGSVGVEIYRVRPGTGLVTVEFRLTGLQAHEQAVFVSISVPPHDRKIPELVDEATALFRKKAELLAKALANLDLSQWD